MSRWHRLSRRSKGVVIIIAVVAALAVIGSPRTPAEPAAGAVLPTATEIPTSTPAVPTAEPTPAGKTAEDYVKQYGGLAGAYRSILGETNCGTLADLFTVANNNHTTGFMAAIDDRMRAIGCP